MADAPKLNSTDTLKDAFPKINSAIDNANEAKKAVVDVGAAVVNANDAATRASTAATNAETRITELNGVDAVQFKDRQDSFDAQLAQRATKEEVANALDGSPKGTYATLADLQTAYPTGTTGIYIVQANGHIYSWDGAAWVDRGQYQSTGIAKKSVTLENLSFSKTTKNLFDGKYYANTLIGSAGAEYISQPTTATPNPTMVMIPVKPSTSYTFKIEDKDLSDRFRVALTNKYPPNNLTANGNYYVQRVIVSNDALTEKTISFTTDADTQYVVAYISSTGQKPRVQLEEGATATSYVPPYLIPKEYIEKETGSQPTTGSSNTVIEDPVNGYSPRPDTTSVIWIGVNEPTEAEPYDEWREVEGFTYFTDFSEYALNASPSDWSTHWATPGAHEVITSATYGGNVFRFKPSVHKRFSTSWNKPSNDLKRIDSEIYFKGRVSELMSGQALSAVHRGSGLEGAETGYTIGVRQTTQDIAIGKQLNGVSSVLKTVANNGVNFTQPYHQVSRVDGDRLRLKVWQDGQPEPSEWLIDIIDPSPITVAGFDGLYSFLSVDNYVYRYGFGTGGMRAPRRKVL